MTLKNSNSINRKVCKIFNYVIEFLLYADGPNHAYFNVLKFIEWLSIGALQAFYGIICYLVLEEA
jgi:hypothetical protein